MMGPKTRKTLTVAVAVAAMVGMLAMYAVSTL
jgi:hypothetical protein